MDTSNIIPGLADTANAKRCPTCACLFLQPREETVRTRTARVEELLRQNYPPLDVELSDFRQVLENTQATIEDLDSRIVQARKLLDNLLSARRQAQSHFEDTKSLLHPMRSIPNELLAEIFDHCIPKEYDSEAPDSLDPREAPWLLTRVSRRWRNLAINSPHLWTYLFLDFEKHPGHISQHQCAHKVCLFTERSRSLPMTVYLGSNDSLQDHLVLPVLGTSIPRWRYLQADLPRPSLQCLSGNTFSMLRTLFLQYDDEDAWDLILDLFQSPSVPVLRNLMVPDDTPWCAFEHVALPWSQVTSIMSFPAFDPDGLDRLRTMTDLEELCVVATSGHTPIHDVVLLSKLRRLTITENHDAPGRSKEFFSALTLPVLSELTLEYDGESVLHFPTSPLLLRNLIKLDITCEMNSHEENTQRILDFLTLTHHVESLRLYDINMTVGFADGLNLDKIVDGLPARLPCLRILDIGECHFAPPDNHFDPFFEMLFSRLPAGKSGGEKTGHAYARMDGAKQSRATTDTGPGFGRRSRVDLNGPPRYLKMVRFPYWLYIQTRREWPDRFLELTSMVELECDVTMRDNFS